MPLPPHGDPSRPLHLAIRSTQTLGVASVLFGLVFVLAFGYFNRNDQVLASLRLVL